MKKQQQGETEAHFLSKLQIQISQDNYWYNNAKLFTKITDISIVNKCLNAVKNHCLRSDNHIIYIIKRNICGGKDKQIMHHGDVHDELDKNTYM